MSSRLVDRFCSVLQPGAVDLVSDTIDRFRLGADVQFSTLRVRPTRKPPLVLLFCQRQFPHRKLTFAAEGRRMTVCLLGPMFARRHVLLRSKVLLSGSLHLGEEGENEMTARSSQME